jgi:hypothetical protein
VVRVWEIGLFMRKSNRISLKIDRVRLEVSTLMNLCSLVYKVK